MAITTLFLLSALAAQPSPYAGQAHRELKSLTPEQVAGYLAGSGMGYAKAAELNHYPGPKHVLGLATELALTDDQVQATQAVFERMQLEAVEAGRLLVEAERAMDRAFAEGSLDGGQLRLAVERIAALEARVRYSHLSAHLEQAALLSGEQIARYDRLRGYATGHRH